MNLVQIQSLSFILGPNNPSRNAQTTVPIPADSRWMCSNQIIQRDDYASFNILGLAVILAVGGLFVLVSLQLQTIAALFTRHVMRKPFHDESWHQSGVLQLHRRVLQVGEGWRDDEWKGLDGDVPVMVETARRNEEGHLTDPPGAKGEAETSGKEIDRI